MVKWKCTVCWVQVQTAAKPSLIERLCNKCKVNHWRKVIAIYETGDQQRMKEAQAKLRAAELALAKEGK